jgi:hypothetical protein
MVHLVPRTVKNGPRTPQFVAKSGSGPSAGSVGRDGQDTLVRLASKSGGQRGGTFGSRIVAAISGGAGFPTEWFCCCDLPYLYTSSRHHPTRWLCRTARFTGIRQDIGTDGLVICLPANVPPRRIVGQHPHSYYLARGSRAKRVPSPRATDPGRPPGCTIFQEHSASCSSSWEISEPWPEPMDVARNANRVAFATSAHAGSSHLLGRVQEHHGGGVEARGELVNDAGVLIWTVLGGTPALTASQSFPRLLLTT